jgi:hypothetical protein
MKEFSPSFQSLLDDLDDFYFPSWDAIFWRNPKTGTGARNPNIYTGGEKPEDRILIDRIVKGELIVSNKLYPSSKLFSKEEIDVEW